MGITAEQGPLVTFGQAQSFDSNPDAGPNAWYQGDMLLDPRGPFTYQPGQRATQPTYGWLSTTALTVIDQAPSTAAANNIAASQTSVNGTPLTLVAASGAGITIGCAITNAATGLAVTGLLGIDVNSATAPQPPIDFGQGDNGSNGPINAWNPLWAISRCVKITNNADDSAATYTIRGYDIYGYPMTQALTGPNNGSVTSTKAFKYIASITPVGTVNSTATTVGTVDTFGLPLRTDRFPYLGIWWGTPQSFINGGSVANQTTLEIPVRFPQLANAQQYQIDVPFDFKLISVNVRVTEAVTTGAKAATLTAQANGSSVTGGVVALAGTYAIGATQAGTAITAGNTGTAGQTVGVVVSGVTTFIEGAGIIELVVQNQDDAGGTFVAAVTTSPATSTTGDVRGTFATPSAADGTKRLTISWSPVPANMTTTAGLVGVTQV